MFDPPAWTRLSPRLRAVAKLVRRDAPLADVGTDHALLPAALVASQTVPHAMATDKNRGPLQRAAAHVAGFGLESSIELRHGPGLSPFSVDELAKLGTIVIAGMGAGTIRTLDPSQKAKVHSSFGLRNELARGPDRERVLCERSSATFTATWKPSRP